MMHAVSIYFNILVSADGKMEGYAFALMANSGTDPDLEAEDELNERLAEAGEIKKASHVKGENQQEDEEEKLSAVSSVERLIERANAKLLMSEEHALQGKAFRCFFINLWFSALLSYPQKPEKCVYCFSFKLRMKSSLQCL